MLKQFFIAITVGLFLAISNADATIIPDDLAVDFRDSIWCSANGSNTYTVGDITVTAAGYDQNLIPYQDYQIYQDEKDGLGISTYKPDGTQTGENDEINKAECLEIKISNGMLLSGVWITDLYDYEYNYNENFKDDEYGHLILNSSTIVDFKADNNGQYPSNTPLIGTNGELWVSFGELLPVFSVDFYPGAYGDDVLSANEYSVAGFTTPVPEPATILLFGIGITALAFTGLRKPHTNGCKKEGGM